MQCSWIKPSVDYPRALGYDYSHKINSKLRQIIGLMHESLEIEEYYKPSEERFYLSSQNNNVLHALALLFNYIHMCQDFTMYSTKITNHC